MRKIIIAALLAGLTVAPARSQDLIQDLVKKKNAATSSSKPAVANDIVSQVVAGNKLILTQLSTNIQQLLTLFGTGDGAIAESMQYPTIQDGNGHDCAIAGRQFTQILSDHPLAVTGDFIDDLENQRVIFSAANQICNLNQCQQVFNELSAQVSKIVTGANGAAGSVVGLIPGVGTVGGAVGAAGSAISSANPFTLVCGNISKIALVTPAAVTQSTTGTVPVVTPVPSPSPSPSATP